MFTRCVEQAMAAFTAFGAEHSVNLSHNTVLADALVTAEQRVGEVSLVCRRCVDWLL